MKIPKEAIKYIVQNLPYEPNEFEKHLLEVTIMEFFEWQAENPCWDCEHQEKRDSHFCWGQEFGHCLLVQCPIRDIREKYKKEV